MIDVRVLDFPLLLRYQQPPKTYNFLWEFVEFMEFLITDTSSIWHPIGPNRRMTNDEWQTIDAYFLLVYRPSSFVR